MLMNMSKKKIIFFARSDRWVLVLDICNSDLISISKIAFNFHFILFNFIANNHYNLVLFILIFDRKARENRFIISNFKP